MVTKYQVKDALRTNKQKVEAELKYNQTFIAQPGLVISEETLKFIQDEIKAMQDYSKALGNLIVDINTSDFKESNKDTIKDPIKVTSVIITPDTATIKIGETTKLNSTVLPDNADNKEVTFKSSNEAVATVDGTGLVTGVSNGEADITVTTTDGSFTKTAKITVNTAV
ncbi:structural protein with Ig domain (endogenous virus) [Lactococcus phage KSY1]|uniref:Gp055 n=1 Tax=Lactococcus phage KSY1 TaxID=2913972 RepID=A6MAC0_9CAUD|nr:structural protein with Ig domain [Lactococcus phage KSY1]ABG21598.1 gp055 [Lactococcus phage KSY1]